MKWNLAAFTSVFLSWAEQTLPTRRYLVPPGLFLRYAPRGARSGCDVFELGEFKFGDCGLVCVVGSKQKDCGVLLFWDMCQGK